MYVCVCNAVTDREIVERVRAGADTLEAIRFELGVATCCGQCADCAREVVETAMRERDASPAPFASPDRRGDRAASSACPDSVGRSPSSRRTERA
jgi:bacterioferritin-associated ferredoxin